MEEEREEFDDVVETVSGHAGRVVLLEADEWSAVDAWALQDEYLGLDYETSDGDRIEITTWADFAADAPGDPDPAEPVRRRALRPSATYAPVRTSIRAMVGSTGQETVVPSGPNPPRARVHPAAPGPLPERTP